MVMMSPFFRVTPIADQLFVAHVDTHGTGADDAGNAHAAGNHRRMAGHAAARGEDALGGMHAVNVLRAGLDAHQNDLAAFLFGDDRLLGGEDDLAGRRPRRGRQAGADDVAMHARIDRRVQKLIERSTDRCGRRPRPR